MKVFEYFGFHKEKKSIYKHAPVYIHEINKKKVIIKRTKEQVDRIGPLHIWQKKLCEKGIKTIFPIEYKNKLYHTIDEDNWVVYPFIEGEKYTATKEQIYNAGELLGKVHSTSDSVFNHGLEWENYDDEFYGDVAGDLETIPVDYPNEFNSENGKKLFERIKSLVENKFESIISETFPTSDSTWDYKASNLIYQGDSLVLIDTDNAGKVPRFFDLALALLLFHTDVDTAPNRVLCVEEWELFLSGYKKHIHITDIEKKHWQDMLLFVYTDEVLWAINDLADDENDRQKDFIKSLVGFNFSQYNID